MTSTETSDRTRWMALYVLCVGVLMIVLDATIVNVALPSIQPDLGFSQSNLAWVVNAYLIAFGGLLLLAGRLGDLIGRRRVFLIGLAIFSAASAAVRDRAEPGDADRRALHPGRRRRADLGRRARDDRDDVPGAARAGEGDRRLRLRRLGGRLDRPARRRRAHRPHQLALDLLRQHPGRHRHRVLRAAADRARRVARPAPRRRHPRRGAADRRPDARRLHDPAGRASRAGARAARSASAPSPSPRWPPSWSASRGSTTR